MTKEKATNKFPGRKAAAMQGEEYDRDEISSGHKPSDAFLHALEVIGPTREKKK